MGATSGTRRWTWDELLGIEGQEGLRYEIIGGELFVNPSAPSWRHQQVVARLIARMLAWGDVTGGDAVPGPNVFFSDTDVVVPDVVCIGSGKREQVQGLLFMGPPDLVIEVSSPSTRRYDLIRKRRLFEAQGVPEYWFVDLDADSVRVFRLERGRYGDPLTVGRGDVIAPPGLAGLKIDVTDVLGPA